MSSAIIFEKIKSTEKIVRQIEIDNVLAFVVDRHVKKHQIKEEMENLFNVKVDKIRTHIVKNKKIAYIKLKKEFPAIDVATKLGLM